MKSDSGTLPTRRGAPHRDSIEDVSSEPQQPDPGPPRLGPAETIDDVARNIELVVSWSIEARSAIGYFAVLYKRVTAAISDAIDDDVFDDGPRMEQLALAFARRYFHALNAFFHPDDYDRPTLPWEVAFVGDQRADRQATILQHMMTGLNAHITFDLGQAAVAVAPESLDALEADFNRVNALLCAQIPDMLDVIEQLSPRVRVIRRIVPDEVGLLKRMLMKLRTSAWYFAVAVALNPDHERERLVNQQSWSAALGAWYLQPPRQLRVVPLLVRWIAGRESPDVAANITALDGIDKPPAKTIRSYL
jgi:hypothetical protein